MFFLFASLHGPTIGPSPFNQKTADASDARPSKKDPYLSALTTCFCCRLVFDVRKNTTTKRKTLTNQHPPTPFFAAFSFLESNSMP